MKNWKKALLIPAATLAISAAMPVEEAQAAKIPIVYNSGDDLFVAGDGSLPGEFAEIPDLAGAQAGYRCNVFGFFGAYFTISDCEAVAFKGDTYWNEPALATAVATAHPEDTMQIGFWKKHGRIPVGLIVISLIGFGIWGQMRSKDDEDGQGAPSAA